MKKESFQKHQDEVVNFLKKSNLYHCYNKKIRRLNSSQLKRFQIAYAFLSFPSLVVLINPFDQMDENDYLNMQLLISSQKDNCLTLISGTKSGHFSEHFSSNVTILSESQLRKQ